MKKSFKYFIVYLPIIFSFVFTISHKSFGQNFEPIAIDADSLIGSRFTPSGHVRDYGGHVKIYQKDVTVHCNLASQYIDQNRAELSGNVELFQEDMVLKSPFIDYNGNTRIAEASKGVEIVDDRSVLYADKGLYYTKTYIADFKGNVSIEDDSARILSKYLIYNRKNRNSFAYDSVYIFSKYSGIILTCDSLRYYPQIGYTFAKGNPVLFKVDTVRKEIDSAELRVFPELAWQFELDTLCIVSDSMRLIDNPENEIYYFFGNVELTKKGLSSTSDSAIFNKTENFIYLLGKPVVWYDSTQLYSDSTVIYVDEDRVKSIEAYGNALAASRKDSVYTNRIDQVSGEVIKILFSGDKLTGIKSTGETRSLYFIFGKDGPDGVDQKAADSIYFDFVDGELEKISWKGGVDSKLFPENMINESISDYYLPNFRWNDVRPKRRTLVLRN